MLFHSDYLKDYPPRSRLTSISDPGVYVNNLDSDKAISCVIRLHVNVAMDLKSQKGAHTAQDVNSCSCLFSPRALNRVSWSPTVLVPQLYGFGHYGVRVLLRHLYKEEKEITRGKTIGRVENTIYRRTSTYGFSGDICVNYFNMFYYTEDENITCAHNGQLISVTQLFKQLE